MHSQWVWRSLACLPFALGALGAGYFGVVNWWGERKLAEHRSWLVANGYAVTLRDYFPPVANPSDDVLQHPVLVTELATGSPPIDVYEELTRSRLAGLAAGEPEVNRECGEHAAVRAWFDPPRHASEAEAAREILTALAGQKPRVAGWVEVLRRPDFGRRASLSAYGADQLRIVGCNRNMRKLAILQLTAGDAAAAADLLDAQLKSVAHLNRRPDLLSGMAATEIIANCAQPVLHEGIVRHAWDEATLARLAAEVGALDPQAAAVNSLRGEIAYSSEQLPHLLDARDLEILKGWRLDGRKIVKRFGDIWQTVRPVGEWKLDLIEYQQHLVAEVERRKSQRPVRFSFDDEHGFKRMLYEQGNKSAWELLAMIGLSNAAENALQAETSRALMCSGIALERYRLKHGRHPQTLDALVSGFLPAVPLDPYDLRPLRFRVLADGTPQVWSVGPDGRDNGGAGSAYGGRHGSGEPGFDRCWVTRPLAAGE